MRDELIILCLTDSSLTLVQARICSSTSRISVKLESLGRGFGPGGSRSRVGCKDTIQATYTTVLVSTVNSETGWQK